MNRAFISLYFFVVASILIIGWGLNQFWENLAPEQEPSSEIRATFSLLEQQLAEIPPADYTPKIEELNAQLPLSLALIPLDTLAKTSALKELSAGAILSINSQDERLWYKRLGKTGQVISLGIARQEESESFVYRLLLMGFYLGIALVIYLWVWPLSRDAKKLELQTHSVGRDGVPESLSISSTSPLHPLAQAFNQMAQRLRELIASHRDMTNAVSHELRTPLARMKFALALIPEQQLESASRRQLASLAQDITEMEALINALLVYAGFEQKSQQLLQTQGYMADLLEILAERLQRNNPRGLQVKIINSTAPECFSCEWKLMETVIQNLISNAARYAQQSIRIEYGQSANDYWIALEDDGPGIPIEARGRVFDSFVRLQDNKDKAPATPGFGLGLAIVKRIMQWHQGEARFVAPQFHNGARIELRWPKA